MPRVVLLLPTATYRASDFSEAAAALGAEVVVASEHRQALAPAMGERALVADFSQPEAAAARIVELARTTPVDAVVAVDDQGVMVAALAGAALGLPHNPPDAVAATRDKARMRRLWAQAHVPQPRFRVAGPEDDVGALATEVGLPCVVKPLALSGSRGVIRADSFAAAAGAATRVRAILASAGEDGSGPLLVESYLPGAEVAVEGLLEGGRLRVLAVFDKPDPMEGPYFEETIYVTPSRLPAPALAAIEAVTAAAVAALGLKEGPVHAELRVEGSDAAMLELAARPIGGLCSRALRFGLLGHTLEEVILRHALGRPVEGLRRESDAAGVMMLPIARAGVLKDVRGQDAALAVPGVVGLELTVSRGRPVVPLPEGDRYLGFLFAKGDSPDQVEAALRLAHSHLEVVLA